MPKNGSLEVSLATLKCEIYTISPVRVSKSIDSSVSSEFSVSFLNSKPRPCAWQVFGEDIHFAPIGLLDMYNSGGAVEAVNCRITDSSECRIKIKGRGSGRFGAYSSTKPKYCMVENKEEDFTYSAVDGLLAIKLQGECNLREIEFVF